MPSNKLYESKAWMMKRYVSQRKSVAEIMAETGASRKTIYNWIDKHGLKR